MLSRTNKKFGPKTVGGQKFPLPCSKILACHQFNIKKSSEILVLGLIRLKSHVLPLASPSDAHTEDKDMLCQSAQSV